MTDRAVTPVVEKTITIGLVALFLAGMTTALFGGAVPAARDAAGASIGQRTLAMASERVEQAVPPNATHVTVRERVDLPGTIRGSGYAISADGRSLVLEHPDASVGGRSRLVLPPSVARVEGAWESGSPSTVVDSSPDGLVVELREGRP